jgi:hypothetical protein
MGCNSGRTTIGYWEVLKSMSMMHDQTSQFYASCGIMLDLWGTFGGIRYNGILGIGPFMRDMLEMSGKLGEGSKKFKV